MRGTNTKFVEISILQTVPPSCVNRDDTGSPKSALFGGVQRARVSSQAWKKATRDYFATHIDASLLGKRTVDALALVVDRIIASDPSIEADEATALGESVFKALGIKLKNGKTGALLFIAPGQVDALAKLAVEAYSNGTAVDGKSAKAIMNIRENPNLCAIDVALFGRMVAEAPDLNIDAAVQVAHAIGVDKMNREFDYYTAVDDLKPDDESGATMIGTVEYLSSTLYRYAVLDALHLQENLGDIDVARAATEQFIRGFCMSMPTGHQNSFANRTLPQVILVTIRDTQPVNLSPAFEQPVVARQKDVPSMAADRMAEYATTVNKAYGTEPIATFVVSTVDSDAISELASEDATSLSDVARCVAEYVFPVNDADESGE